jgi:preprotein translocase subunit SecE
VLLAVGAGRLYGLGQAGRWVRVGASVAAARWPRCVLRRRRRQASGRSAATPGARLKKVVWPTRNEAMQMTGCVFVFVVVMALFLWLTDKTLEWVSTT